MNKILSRFVFFFIIGILLFNNSTESVYASSGQENAITKVLCNVVNLLTGNIAKGVAIIAIVVVAVGLFMGKFSWGVGLATAIGIAMIFGAASVVDWLSKGIGSGTNLDCKIISPI
jgi:type IV secretory pathway VirB2 component (pilin)